MRIALNAQLVDDRSTGIGVVARSLIEGLRRAAADDELHVFTQGDIAPSENLRVHRASLAACCRAGRILWESFALPHALDRLGIDVFHATAYVAPRRVPCTYVLTLHDVIALVHPEFCSRANARHFRLRIPPSARRAARIVASSENTKRDILRTLDVAESRIVVIHPPVRAGLAPVDDPHALEAVRRRYRLPERYILFLGNLEPKKNLATMLQTFAILKGRARRETPVVAGRSGWRSREALASLDELARSGEVVRPGFIAPDDLAALYSAASAFYFPSLYEGFGLPVLEAMACGTSVVCSSAASLPEVAGDAAVLVDPLDAEAHADALERVCDDEVLRARLSRTGRERASHFDLDTFARRHLDIYHEIGEGPARHG